MSFCSGYRPHQLRCCRHLTRTRPWRLKLLTLSHQKVRMSEQSYNSQWIIVEYCDHYTKFCYIVEIYKAWGDVKPMTPHAAHSISPEQLKLLHTTNNAPMTTQAAHSESPEGADEWTELQQSMKYCWILRSLSTVFLHSRKFLGWCNSSHSVSPEQCGLLLTTLLSTRWVHEWIELRHSMWYMLNTSMLK